MRKCTLLCLLCLLFWEHNIYAQKIRIDEIDTFTGNRIVETSIVKIATPKSDFKIRVEHDSINLEIQLLKIIGLSETSIKADKSELLILTNKGEKYRVLADTINWENIEKHSSIHWGAGISSGWSSSYKDINIKFHLDSDTLQTLNNSTIEDMRINIGNLQINFELDPYEKKSISKLFQLVMQKL